MRNRFSALGDYWTLTKPEVNFLVVVSTLVGFYLGSHGRLDWLLLVHTLLGTLLVASGTATLNQFMEREADSRMRRTSVVSSAKTCAARSTGCRRQNGW